MSRIEEALKGKKVFIGSLTAGDPSLEKTQEFIQEIEAAGASLIEIGIPFSDPIAEGQIIQDANVRALSAPGGCTTDMIFDMVAKVRGNISVPLVFVLYLNQVYKYGYERFCQKCQETGVDGLVIPDLPYEERGELAPIAEKYGVDVISMIAPAGEDRIKMIAKEAKGYIYLAASVGAEPEMMVRAIREVTDIPVVVGYGIHTPEQVQTYSKIADGVIVDDPIVELIGTHREQAGTYLRSYVKSMKAYMEE